MPFLREGIENVRAVVLPDAVTAGGHGVGFSRAALVTWKSNLEGMLYQVYLHGRLAGVTIAPLQRQLVIGAPSSFEAAVHVEVVAVEPADSHRDFTRELGYSAACNARVKLTLLRSQNLPTAAMVKVYFDHGTGNIDYSAAMNDAPVPLWPCRQDKAGLGLAQFGTGDFGYDAAASIGFGKGVFGRGQFGLDADTMEWTSRALPLGQYRFGVKLVDRQGNESLAGETPPMAIVPPVRPASKLDVVTFDEQTNKLTLSISD